MAGACLFGLMQYECEDHRPPPPALSRRLAAHRRIFALLRGDEFPEVLARTCARVSGHMLRLGSENPFVAAIDLAQSLSAQEDPNAPLLLLAAFDLHEARTQSLEAAAETLVSDSALALRATVDRLLSAWNPDGAFVAATLGGGRATRDDRLWVADQSRHIYALARAYEFTGDLKQLGYANALADAFRVRFIDRSVSPPSLHEMVQWDPVAKRSLVKGPAMMNAAVQACGIAGLVALYRVTKNEALLRDIHGLHAGFIERFHDMNDGGFLEQVARNGGESEGFKSYASTVGVATSYLLDLDGTDCASGAPDYRRYLRELADIVVDRFLDEQSGFVIEHFDAHWNPAWRGWQRQEVDGMSFTIGRVGRDMRTAWFLLRMFETTGTERYLRAALRIVSAMLAYGFDWIEGGVFDCAKREETDAAKRWMWGKRKAWWHQGDAIKAFVLALKLGVLREVEVLQGTGKQALEMTLAFWQRHARATGDEYEYVTANGNPVAGTVCPIGKAGYNMAELLATATQSPGISPEDDLNAVEALRTPFLEGLRSGAALDALRPLLEDMHIRCLLNHPNAIGLTPVMLSAAFGRLDVLCALEARGAFVDAINEHTGENILHYAAMAGARGEAVKRYILDHHSEILARFDDCSPSNNKSGGATTSAFNARNVVVPFVADRTTPAEGRTERRS